MIAIGEDLTRGAWDELSFHFAPHIVLSTALKLGIFSVIAKGAKNVEGIASATDCSTRGIRMTLNCLAALGFLEKEKENYDLNRMSRTYFLPASEDYIGNLFAHGDQLMELWLTLPEAVKTGEPTISILQEKERERLNINIVDGLFQAHRVYAWKLVDLLKSDLSFLKDDQASLNILDVAAGSAVWSIPFALRYVHAKVTAVDFVPVLEVARKYTRRFGVEKRYRLVGGDIRDVDFGSERYSVVLLGHICHSEGPAGSQRLIGKCFRALRKNGLLLIMDHIPDEGRRSAVLPLLLALNALLGTREGDTFTFSEYRQWLMSAGFSAVKTIEISGHSPVMVGVKS